MLTHHTWSWVVQVVSSRESGRDGKWETGDFGERREILVGEWRFWWEMDQTVWQRDLDPSYVVAKEVVMSDGREVKSWC